MLSSLSLVPIPMFEYAPPFVANEARRIRVVHGGPATAVIIVATVVGVQRSHIF